MKYMKYVWYLSYIFNYKAVAILLLLSFMGKTSRAIDRYHQAVQAEKIESNDNRPVSDMFFSTSNVTEEYEHDCGYCLVYSDPDANLDETVIEVDYQTYASVIGAIKSGKEITGTLTVNHEFSSRNHKVFTLIPNIL